MLKIALGSDHRGGKIAETIFSDVLYPEHSVSESLDLPSSSIPLGVLGSENGHSSFIGSFPKGARSLFATKEGMPWFGAVLVTCEKDDRNKTFHGINVEPIPVPTLVIPGYPDNARSNNNGGENGNGDKIRVDYPDIAAAVASKVSRGEVDFGILICGTGIGMSIVANKFRGVRAADCYSEMGAELSRRHNNANVLCIPGEMLGPAGAVSLVRKWLSTDYEGGRHQIRVEKIDAIEKRTFL